MALIEYPLENYDTFCSLADAETLILNNIPATQTEAWNALAGDTQKEVQLRQATLLIKNKITLPDTLEDDLKLATAYLANASTGNDVTDDDGSGNVKIKEITGVVKTEFFSPNKSNDDFPNMVTLLLSKYEVVQDGTFTFSRA